MNNLDTFLSYIPKNISFEDIDNLLISDQNILRPLRGLAFEYLVDDIFLNHFKVKLHPGSGDSDIDRFFYSEKKKISIQIKTPVIGLTKENKSVSFALHKTHGLEKKPQNLYPIEFPCPICEHDGESFSDFLIAKHPTEGVYVIPKNSISENKKYPGHFADPFVLDWKDEKLNKWSELGFSNFDNQNLLRSEVKKQKKFKKVSKLINLTDDEIISLFLKPENFRLFRMNLLGNLREPALKKFLFSSKIKFEDPKISYPPYDVTVKDIKIQIKGVSQHLCKDNVIGTEVMGTHGKNAIRRYSKNDFDYLCLVLDPRYLKKFGQTDNEYKFIFIKSEDLPDHPRNEEWGTDNKIYENIKLEIVKKNKKLFFIPASNYRIKLNFKFKEIEMNKIPKEFF